MNSTRSAAVHLRLCLLAFALLVAGCNAFSRLHWPWSARPQPGPEVAHELAMTAGEGAASVSFPQYWQRNTLVVDLQSASGTGSVVLRPREGAQWPVRLALRVMPGRVGVLDVLATQRVVLPITAEGTQPIDLELPPSAYSAETEQITVRWSATRPE